MKAPDVTEGFGAYDTSKRPRRISSTDLRKCLASILRDAHDGIATQVTMNGIPVAEIGPVSK